MSVHGTGRRSFPPLAPARPEALRPQAADAAAQLGCGNARTPGAVALTRSGSAVAAAGAVCRGRRLKVV
eukprot:275318-Chlamydomonas_euryale.AAC.1